MWGRIRDPDPADPLSCNTAAPSIPARANVHMTSAPNELFRFWNAYDMPRVPWYSSLFGLFWEPAPLIASSSTAKMCWHSILWVTTRCLGRRSRRWHGSCSWLTCVRPDMSHPSPLCSHLRRRLCCRGRPTAEASREQTEALLCFVHEWAVGTPIRLTSCKHLNRPLSHRNRAPCSTFQADSLTVSAQMPQIALMPEDSCAPNS